MRTYTFHVSIPGTGRVWRKVEMRSDQTLEDLHFAIQDAFDFDADHLYSFFMSGRAWDRSTEYCLPEGVDPWGFFDDQDLEEEDSLVVEPEIDQETGEALRAALGEDEPPQSVESMFALLESNPELRAEVIKMMSEQFGVPAFMADMLLNNASSLLASMPDGLLEDFGEAGDVRTTTLESLNLAAGQAFMYLFDYGDEWRFKVRVHGMDDAADDSADYPRVVEVVGDAPEQYPYWDDDEEWDDDLEWDEEGKEPPA